MEEYRQKIPFEVRLAAFYIILIIAGMIVTKNPVAVALAVSLGLGLMFIMSKVLGG